MIVFVAAAMTVSYEINDQGCTYADGVSLGYSSTNQVTSATILGNVSVIAVTGTDINAGGHVQVSLSGVGCLMNSAVTWRCSSSSAVGWTLPTFDSSSWTVQSLSCAPDASTAVNHCPCSINIGNMATVYCLTWLN
jgi:hypothetical protein